MSKPSAPAGQTAGSAAPAASTKRIMVVANKSWEAAPLMDVLLEKKACPDGFPAPTKPPDGAGPRPRALFTLGNSTAEIWCLQDWMNPDPKLSSSSAEKIRVLPGMFTWNKTTAPNYRDPDFVVAFGTAGLPDATSFNGCVAVGGKAFMYNAYPNKSNPQSPWEDPRIGQVLTSPVGGFFSPKVLDEALRYQVEARLLVPPLNPARERIILAAANYTAVGDVNVTNYDDYAWADEAALKAFRDADPKDPVGSVETTHGLIRLQSEAPFLFVSGITDRIGYFNMEVAPRAYAQNFVAAHNAGVFIAWALARIVAFLG